MKSKLEMAHDWYLKQLEVHESASIHGAWQYADAMQAEADKREDKTRPDVLYEVDWSVAPDDAIGWVMMQNYSYWNGEEGYLIEDAPSFGFTGSHIVERPR